MKRSREGKVIISSAAAALYVILFSDQCQTLLYFSDPPKVRLSLGSSIDPKAISEGNDVYMDCEIRANPKAYKVEWSHNVRKIFLHSSTHCLNIVKKSLIVDFSIFRLPKTNIRILNTHSNIGERTPSDVKIQVKWDFFLVIFKHIVTRALIFKATGCITYRIHNCHFSYNQ